MKYVLTLLAGFLVGVSLVAAGVYFNPGAQENLRVPLTAAPDASTEVFYRLDSDTVLRTGPVDGPLAPVPATVEELWEPTLAGTDARLVLLRDAGGLPIGIGMRMAALAETTRPLTGKLLAQSVWNIHLNGRGSLFVDAVDNLWPLARGVFVPAWSADDQRWQGRFEGDITVGPGATHVASMTGGSRSFAGIRGEARESLTVEALSLADGRLDGEGSVLVVITGSGPLVSQR